MSTDRSALPPPGAPLPRRRTAPAAAAPRPTAPVPETPERPDAPDKPERQDAAVAEPLPEGVTFGTLTIPLAEAADTQVYRINAWHVDCQFRDAPTRAAFNRLRTGLDQSGARLGDGRRVISGADAVRWLMEQIAKVDHEKI